MDRNIGSKELWGMGKQGAYASVRKKNAWELDKKLGMEINNDKKKCMCMFKEREYKIGQNERQNVKQWNVGVWVKDLEDLHNNYIEKQEESITDENNQYVRKEGW